MKTLIFNGSPRRNGDTMQLVNEFIKHLDGEYELIDAYYCGVKPCIDCRYCVTHPGCSQKDAMGPIYDAIQDSDNIVVASPLNFAQPTGMLLAVLSRLQTYYCARVYRHETPIPKAKRGGIILVGGGDGPVQRAEQTMRLLLHHMNAKDIGPLVCSHDTDRTPPKDDAEAMGAAKALADFLNQNV